MKKCPDCTRIFNNRTKYYVNAGYFYPWYDGSIEFRSCAKHTKEIIRILDHFKNEKAR